MPAFAPCNSRGETYSSVRFPSGVGNPKATDQGKKIRCQNLSPVEVIAEKTGHQPWRMAEEHGGAARDYGVDGRIDDTQLNGLPIAFPVQGGPWNIPLRRRDNGFGNCNRLVGWSGLEDLQTAA